ncbi:DUF647 domain-containing protein [Aspergillus sclerotialis]|uniref:DUF647 domain-containing protein n=1 Tax=Aspergillus sclerotialis TaxID=2070753 RepID=A0A3A3A989_9EURO|nr:DUF647 domain-containing protein [Aspergillus sclerotialis]
MGVGNASASPTSALLLHILQDSSGRLATILFAHRVGTALEPECKMYRLAADVFNDIAMILDCLSPLIPSGVCRVTILSTAGVLRALCGVAGGSSKASLSAHFSRWGNLAEKDSSQETIISLVGMLVGSYVVSRITSFTATWTALIILLTLHLSMNYIAVRSVQMTSLNRQRANIVFSTLLDSDSDLDLGNLDKHRKEPLQTDPATWIVLTPAEVSKRERIFERDGTLNWTPSPLQRQIVGICRIGVSLPSFLTGATPSKGRSIRTTAQLSKLVKIFASESYMLSFSYRGAWQGRIILKPDCNVESQLKAWAHALLTARMLSLSPLLDTKGEAIGLGMKVVLDAISQTLEFLNEDDRFGRYIVELRGKGWDLGIAALETKSGRRVTWK